MTRAPPPMQAPRPDQREEAVIGKIRDALRQMQFGTIALTVHNARVVQLDITEKRRFES